MSKDSKKKAKGSWWYGWVKFTYTDYNGAELEGRRTTVYEFATVGQAKRAAEALAGALTAPHPVANWERKYRSKTKKLERNLTVVETGASRAED